ncbi:synaptic vesicle glycoprotein 2B [Leptinotarsa decemlineata]|uniref:synaptic vesicle glycoprotein 2B n=1 Tax=Leptinotarsa decemlineata TaxID=7539 RepID=UPI003D30CB3B
MKKSSVATTSLDEKRVEDLRKSQDASKMDELADFETAVEATGFGKFNLILLLISVPTSLSQAFEQMTLSFVIPIAQCDLHLTLEDKGMLNAIAFAGMISSGFVSGYLCDFFGRRKMIIIGHTLQAFFTILASLSQTFPMLMAAKFFSGFCFNGGFSAFTSYLTEWHSSKYRGVVQLIRGTAIAFGNVVVPLLAWGILPQSIYFRLFGVLDIHSWNVFILATILAPLICASTSYFAPESPKFLMTSGRNEEALRVFRMAYSMNTGKSVESYPIKQLVDERSHMTRRKSVEKIKNSFQALKPLITPPYLYKLILVCITACFILMGNHSLKLWFPQLLQSINDYQQYNNGSSSGMCDIIDFLNEKTTTTSEACDVNLDNSSVYINAIIIGCVQIAQFTIAGFFLRLLGHRVLAGITTSISGACAIGIYFAKNSTTITALFSIFIGFFELAGNTVLTMTLEIFPTTCRTTALSFHLTMARIGSITGNMIFSKLISSGCLYPFIFCGGLAFTIPILMCFYPNLTNKALV